jgi:antitoxin component of MazEF toxin-antitoxin module
MVTETMTVQLTPEGTLPLPLELRQWLNLKPLQTVHLKKGNGYLLIIPSRQEIGERILALMKEGLAGITQNDIDQGRANNEDRG